MTERTISVIISASGFALAALAAFVGFVSSSAITENRVARIEGVVNVGSVVRFENRMTSLEARVSTEEFVGQQRGAEISQINVRLRDLERTLDRMEADASPKSCPVR